jgi:hypothetical protein
MADSSRARRAALNESAFRAVNERVAELGAWFQGETPFVCECARAECSERLRMPMEEYRRARSFGERFFIVAPGHEQPEFERVVAEHDGWLVVEKVGEAGDVAAEHDTRDP